MEAGVEPTERAPQGWYVYGDGMRLWDGSAWTDHYAPAPPDRVPLSESHVAWAVFKGVLAALIVFWLLVGLLLDASL